MLPADTAGGPSQDSYHANMYTIASAATWRGVEYTPRWPLRITYLDDIKIPEQEQCRPGRRAQVYAAKAHMQPSGPHPQYSQANKHLRSGVVLNGHVQPSEPLSREMCASSGCELTSSAQLAEQRQSSVKIQFSCRPMWYAGRLQHYHHLFFVSSHPI